LYAQHAESVTLLLYSPEDLAKPVLSLQFDSLHNMSGRIWHCRVPRAGMCDARYYAYLVSGQTRAGLRGFDHEKILLDPYPKVFSSRRGLTAGWPSSPGRNAGKAPLGVLPGPPVAFDWEEAPSPKPESDAIIYELHVKGFTKNSNSAVNLSRAGTYAGVIEKIPYLQELGITVVELMPIFQSDPQEGDF
jgi:isoamylase